MTGKWVLGLSIFLFALESSCTSPVREVEANEKIGGGNELQESFRKHFGGSRTSRFNCVQGSSEGGYIAAGEKDDIYAYVVKVDEKLEIVWEKTFGVRGASTSAQFVLQLDDGSYLIRGRTEAAGEPGNKVYFLNIDSNGKKLFEKVLDVEDRFSSQATLVGTPDGAVVFLTTVQEMGPVPKDRDLELIKADRRGEIRWRKRHGTGEDVWGMCLAQSKDGGFIIAGSSGINRPAPIPIDPESIQSYIPERFGDVYLCKVDPGGEVEWQEVYKRDGDQFASAVLEVEGGGFVVAGTSEEKSGRQVLLMKVDNRGEIVWEKFQGGECGEMVRALKPMPGGGYAALGETCSSGAGYWDILLMTMDTEGRLLSRKTFGDRGNDYGYDLIGLEDGGFLIAGSWDLAGRKGENRWSDAVLLKVVLSIKK